MGYRLLAEEQLLFIFCGEGADQGSFPGFVMDISRPPLGFLSQSANVLAVLLSGSTVFLWCRALSCSSDGNWGEGCPQA